MAGRKRKTYTEMTQGQLLETVSVENVWNTAIYARLSIENSKKDDDGESIEGQVEICREYIDEHPYLHLKDTYVDNGWTGTNTNRPEFQRLLDDIRDGRIKALVIKDFSRFSRDYIEAGNLLENIFPALGIRLISVADRYDSFETDGSAQSLMIPLKNLINSYYSKDISKKVSTAVHTKQLAGEHIPSMIPYGYCKSTTRAYRFEPDPETAPVVRRIFQDRLNGVGYSTIARNLNTEGVPSPGKLRYQRRQTTDTRYATSIWSAQAIKQIIKNPTYTGDLVFGRMPTALYLGKPNYSYEPDESQWRILPDMHEALIDRESFDLLKAEFTKQNKEWKDMLKAGEKARAKNEPFFKDIIHCGDCHTKLGYARHGNTGAYYCRNPLYGNCKGTHQFRQEPLKEIVWHVIQDQLALCLNYEKLLADLQADNSVSAVREYQNEIQSLSIKLNSLRKKREGLYEDYADGILSSEDYMVFKQRFDAEYQSVSIQLGSVQTRLAKLKKSLSSENRWYRNTVAHISEKSITRELVVALIEDVLIYEDENKKRRVEVVLKYRDELEILMKAYEEIYGGEQK